jgi:hypothetical protein
MLVKYRDVLRAIIAPVLKPVVESPPFGELIADLVYKLRNRSFRDFEDDASACVDEMISRDIGNLILDVSSDSSETRSRTISPPNLLTV